jgi:Arm DNA-binding domain/Phage integrase, N-terminal SAM-like domain
MRGSIRKRGSTYTYVLDLPPDPVTGKRRQKTKGGFRTKRECQAALNEAIMAVQPGTYVEASRRTVRSFLLEEWLPDREPPKLRATTYASYQTQITTHVVPGLGSVELQRLSPAQLNAFYRRLLAGGRRDGQGLAPKTVKNIHAILHRALKDAVRWAMWSATWLMRWSRPRAAPPRCGCGRPSSSGPSSPMLERIGCMPPGCWWPPRGCAAGSWPGCAGLTSTWTRAGPRRVGLGWW